MILRSTLGSLLPVAIVSWGVMTCQGASAPARAARQAGVHATSPAAQQAASSTEPARLPRGKKLVLKDGSYQLVRNYERNGERVRYFSVERGAWEEIPAAMVDWDATKKAEVADEKTTTALLEKARIQEAAAKAETPVDVDASLMVAPGVFLPDGEGMFATEGKSVKRLGQVGSAVKTDKTTVLKHILSPIPIMLRPLKLIHVQMRQKRAFDPSAPCKRIDREP